ncbi:MAG: hypothetical protein JRF70_17125 [Deltaproteobacteria bacterium]|nr:hypothetical protein [Deltaproteobacteria bacterium]
MKRTLILVLTCTALACAGGGGSYVSHSIARGPYIDATLSLSGQTLRFLFPQTEDCARALRPETVVSYSSGGSFGRVKMEDGTVCNPVGIGTLRRWRRARVEGEMAPSSPARWSILHKDAQVYLLRGRFPVASRLGVANTFDVVVMVANDDVCRPIAESGEATLVFRQSGSRVLDLGKCPVIAVATPL